MRLLLTKYTSWRTFRLGNDAKWNGYLEYILSGYVRSMLCYYAIIYNGLVAISMTRHTIWLRFLFVVGELFAFLSSIRNDLVLDFSPSSPSTQHLLNPVRLNGTDPLRVVLCRVCMLKVHDCLQLPAM
jgi:hypothetical protein